MTFVKKSFALAAILSGTVATGALAQSMDADVGAQIDAGDVSIDSGIANASSGGLSIDGSGEDSLAATAGELDAEAGAEANTMVTTTADAAPQEGQVWTYDRVVASISAENNGDIDFSAINDRTDLDVMALSTMEGDEEQLNIALADADMSEMNSSIEGNADLKASLEAEGYQPEDVVGIYAFDGSYQVIVDDRS